jgi:hypothetical protein
VEEVEDTHGGKEEDWLRKGCGEGADPWDEKREEEETEEWERGREGREDVSRMEEENGQAEKVWLDIADWEEEREGREEPRDDTPRVD